jgi:malonyl-CoA/methylmalonyl-CoA synthetase
MLLSSEKFKDKAAEVVKEGLESQPLVAVEKITEGKKSAEYITLEEPKSEDGGMMLYTSGTTNRPVCLHVEFIRLSSNTLTEGSRTSIGRAYSTV